MKKLLATDDWLARHPKVIAALLIIGFLITGSMETIC